MNNQELFNILGKLKINYTIKEHEEIFTVEDADNKNLIMEGLNLKNLLLKNKKNNKFYLVILDDHRRLDFNILREVLGTKKLTFANEEELFRVMNLVPGMVGPFGLIYDKDNEVSVILTKEIKEASSSTLVNFHPNRNNATMAITKEDFLKYLTYLNKEIIYE